VLFSVFSWFLFSYRRIYHKTVKYDVIIIGGGAAGLFCASEAGKRGRKTLVIEHNAQVGRKIIISGGGRCNFTNIYTTSENFVSQNPHFCKSALARYTPEDFIKLIKKHKINFYEKKLGQLFCRESSQLIVDMLLTECAEARVKILTSCSVEQVRAGRPHDSRRDGGVTKSGAAFELETNLGEFSCESLVIASGGLSFPKIGASSFGYDIAKQFGVKRTRTQPALVPLVFAGDKGFTSLAGVSLDARVATAKQEFRENILFTHRGLSGPAILQISNYVEKNREVSIDLLPELSEPDFLEQAGASLQTTENFLSKFLPKRFAEVFTAQNFSNKSLHKLGKKETEKIAGTLKNWQVKFGETEGYDKAEVTLGGVATGELSSQTMETKRVPGLYFIGEVVDVTGWLGGYNFQWAWASGYAAGQAV
jgi:predicted Rossmann fold flavoprotein